MDVLRVRQVPVELPLQDVVYHGTHCLLDVSLTGRARCTQVLPGPVEVQRVRTVRLLHQSLLLNGPPEGMADALQGGG